MAIEADRTSAPAGDFRNRLKRARFVLIAAAIVFAALVALGPLTPVEGLITFAAIAVASLIGTVDEVASRLAQLENAGVSRVVLHHIDHRDLEMIDLVGAELVPAVT